MGLLNRALYRARDVRYRAIFASLRRHAHGHVLDVGGGSFFESARAQGVPFESWTVVEPAMASIPPPSPGLTSVIGDGQRLGLADASFDTVISVQVIEHVFEPMRMLQEMYRVTKPGGRLVLVVPQTSNLHLVPHHYQNFTRFWLLEAARRLGCPIAEYQRLGGAWSTIASRLVMQVPSMFGHTGFRDPDAKRNAAFWVLLPFALVFSAAAFPIAMVLSLGDVGEEPNNHLIVLQKPR